MPEVALGWVPGSGICLYQETLYRSVSCRRRLRGTALCGTLYKQNQLLYSVNTCWSLDCFMVLCDISLLGRCWSTSRFTGVQPFSSTLMSTSGCCRVRKHHRRADWLALNKLDTYITNTKTCPCNIEMGWGLMPLNPLTPPPPHTHTHTLPK